ARGPQRGADMEAELHLSFSDAVRGVTTSVNLQEDARCHTCNGSGAAPGTGTERRNRTVKVRIPAGVEDGQRIRVKGRGAPGQGMAPAGDLYVVVRVGRDTTFGRRGRNLTLTVPVTFPEAALGTTVTVPTLDDPVTLRVPAGTQPGTQLRVRGRGVPAGGGRNGAKAGDLLVRVELTVPKTLTDEQRAAVESLATALGTAPNVGQHSASQAGAGQANAGQANADQVVG